MRLCIDLENVQFNITGQTIEMYINCEFSTGDIVWLCGDVGCGKTTLLKIITGIIPQYENAIYSGKIDFRDIQGSTSIITNIVFQHVENQIFIDTAERLLSDLNIEGFQKDRYTGSLFDLSKGQRKYLVLLSELYRSHDLLILDEPIDYLDSEKASDILSRIHSQSANCITFIASHDENVSKICNKILLYNRNNHKWELIDKNAYIMREKRMLRISSNMSSSVCIEPYDISFPNGKHLIQRQSYNIELGTWNFISGKNGSGKTTLLDIIIGSRKYKNRQSLTKKLGIAYGYLFQNNYRQLFSMTVLNELTFGLKKNNQNTDELDYLLDTIGLSDQVDNNPIFLSAGQKQKLILASIIMHHPDLYIMDELCSNLDIKSIECCINLLDREVSRNGSTIIIADQENEYFYQDEINLIKLEENLNNV